MICTEQWRARIGCFNTRRLRPAASKPSVSPLYIDFPGSLPSLKFTLLVLLLLCGDIESNPGPASSKGKTKQTTLRLNQSVSDQDCPDSPHPLQDLTTAIQALSSQFDKFDTKINSLEQTIKDFEKISASLRNQVEGLSEEMAKLNDENKELKLKIEQIEARQEEQESRSRRNNLLLHGVQQTANESWDDTELKFRQFVSDHLQINGSQLNIDRAHRLRTSTQACPIIVRFASYKDRDAVLKARRKLKDSAYSIQEDFTLRVRNTRKKLSPFVNKFREEGKRATLVFDHMIVDGVRYDLDPTTDTLQPKQRPYQHTASTPAGQRRNGTTPEPTPSRRSPAAGAHA